jgi:hypothetical protein
MSRAMASATSPTNTGANLVMPPPISGNAGAKRLRPAKRLKKLSSGPNTIDGRMMMAPGNAARARFSPSAFERAYSAVEFSSAPMADIWMKHPCLGGTGRLGAGLGTEGVDGIEALRSGGIENARQVDDGIGAVAGRGERGGIADIGLNRHDLAGGP